MNCVLVWPCKDVARHNFNYWEPSLLQKTNNNVWALRGDCRSNFSIPFSYGITKNQSFMFAYSSFSAGTRKMRSPQHTVHSISRWKIKGLPRVTPNYPHWHHAFQWLKLWAKLLFFAPLRGEFSIYFLHFLFPFRFSPLCSTKDISTRNGSSQKKSMFQEYFNIRRKDAHSIRPSAFLRKKSIYQ